MVSYAQPPGFFLSHGNHGKHGNISFQMTILGRIALFGNKGWFCFEVLLQASLQDTSQKNNLSSVISNSPPERNFHHITLSVVSVL
jgi:hypothetical protein